MFYKAASLAQYFAQFILMIHQLQDLQQPLVSLLIHIAALSSDHGLVVSSRNSQINLDKIVLGVVESGHIQVIFFR